MPDVKTPKVPDSDRISELWAAVKVLLAGKVDTETLKDYPKMDAVVTAITEALKTYPTDTEMKSAISQALSDYMTTSEINDAIADAVSSASGLHYELVEQLPEEGETNIIYLLPNGKGEEDIYDEWFYFNSKWERIGSTGVDLSNYWSKEELQIMTAEELEEILT